jgi:hypothetical protein
VPVFKFLFMLKGTIVGTHPDSVTADSGVGIAMVSHVIEFPTRDEADFAALALEATYPGCVTKLYRGSE